MDGVLEALDGDAMRRAGLDGMLVEHLIAAGRFDELGDHLGDGSGSEAPADRAWILWCRARAALSAGRFEEVRSLFGDLRSLGFDSRVLDALESLGGASGAAGEESGAADPFNAIIGLEARWTGGEDLSPIARSLAGWEDMSGGLADLAYAAARMTGDTFLRQKVLDHWLEAGGPRSEIALLDSARLHGFARPAADALAEALKRCGGSMEAPGMCAVLLSLPALSGAGRETAAEQGLRAIAARILGEGPDDPAVDRHVEYVLGGQERTADPPDAYGPLEIHRLLGSEARSGASRSLEWLARAVEAKSPGLEPGIAGAVASVLLSESTPDAALASIPTRGWMRPRACI
jgi:hypothetical protein